MEPSGSGGMTPQMLTNSFIHIVNGCLDKYYRDPRSSFGALSYPMKVCERRMFKEDIEEYTRSRSFARIFQDLAKANHWHQAVQFLLNCLDFHLPPVMVLQNILDTMLLIDAESFVVEAQLYLHQLITFYPPKTDDMAYYYWDLLKEEDVEQKRVSSPRDPCGSLINVLHQLEAELNSLEHKTSNSGGNAFSGIGVLLERKTSESNDYDDEEGDENAADHNEEILELCDATLLSGKHLKFWWASASCEQRIHRLLYVLSIMNVIFQLDVNVWKSRSEEAQKHPLARPIISRLIWPRNDANPSSMIVQMVVSMYAVCHRNDLFECMAQIEQLVNVIALTLPSSPWDEGEGYPPDSHQRRVFAHHIAMALIDSRLSDEKVDIALARLSPDWFRLIVSSKIHSHRSKQSCGDLPLNVVQLAKMIIQGLSWGDEVDCSFDSSVCSDEEEPHTSTKGRKRKAVKRNAIGETQLHILARTGKSEKLSKVLAVEGTNINVADYAGWTPMHEAVSHGHLDCVRVLCQYKHDVANHKMKLRHNDQKSGNELSSKKSGSLTAVNLHAKGGTMGLTPLHDAVFLNHIHIAATLLKFGGSSLLNDTTNAGLTAFDMVKDDRMMYLLKDSKLQAQKVEKEWLSEMKSNVTHLPYVPSDRSCVSLRCILLNCYLETHCLHGLTENFRKVFQKTCGSKSIAGKNIDYLERHHDVKALRYFRRAVKSRLCGGIHLPEAYLLIFLC